MSKSTQVDRYIRGCIATGRWSPGSSLPSSDDLCRELGVSAITVRNVMARMAQEGLIVRRQRLGTFVADKPARHNVALMMSSDLLASPLSYYYHRLWQCLRDRLDGAGLAAMVVTEYGESEEVLRLLLKNTVAVVAQVGPDEVRPALQRMGIPLLWHAPRAPEGDDAVEPDHRRMLALADETLRRHGHPDYCVMAQRMEDEDPATGEHWRDARALVGGDLSRLVRVPASWDCRHAYETFKAWWRSPARRRAVFFDDDGVCDVALRAVQELGVRVPEELAILTETSKGRHFVFPRTLARVEFDPEAVADATWERLSQRLKTPDAPGEHVRVPPRFVPGESLPEPR